MLEPHWAADPSKLTETDGPKAANFYVLPKYITGKRHCPRKAKTRNNVTKARAFMSFNNRKREKRSGGSFSLSYFILFFIFNFSNRGDNPRSVSSSERTLGVIRSTSYGNPEIFCVRCYPPTIGPRVHLLEYSLLSLSLLLKQTRTQSTRQTACVSISKLLL